MNTSENLQQQLSKVLSGEPWYGPSVYSILEKVSFEAAYEKPPGSAHNIAEIVLHMIAWTEEVIDRMNSKTASDPVSGDWPDTGAPDEQKWQNYVEDFKLVNVNLMSVITHFPEEQWEQVYADERTLEPVITYKQMVEGLIQHNIYHSGQIALLLRITQM